ncbi:MAG: hypothetical protein KAS77_00875 [Thermoplasmata archaeon]|nr:hypothetical protein [Thermoplasmata archaeon]
MPKCKTCQQEIVWGMTENNKRVPLDPAETRYISHDGPGDDRHLYVKMVPTHLSHFATCPQADQHRRTTPPLPGSTEDYRGGHDDG